MKVSTYLSVSAFALGLGILAAPSIAMAQDQAPEDAEIAQETVAMPKDVLDRIAALKEQGRKNALLMLASKTGELRFVTIRMD